MERLKSIEEYKALLMQYKQVCRRGYNNNYLGLDKVNRYIALQRIYYETVENALMFITDEEAYYRMYIQTDAEAKVIIKKEDKPVLIRNVYKENRKPEALLKLEENLGRQGFKVYDESVQIVARPLDMRENIQNKYDRAEAFLKRAGIKILYAKEGEAEEILNLREKEPLLKKYHFLYETKEEISADIRKGYYRCAYNAQGEICAAQHFYVSNGTLQGDWLAVKEEYKIRYGIGTAMACHSFLYAIEHDISQYFGWVVRDNKKSIDYHQAIGYEISDKLADEWLLE